MCLSMSFPRSMQLYPYILMHLSISIYTIANITMPPILSPLSMIYDYEKVKWFSIS